MKKLSNRVYPKFHGHHLARKKTRMFRKSTQNDYDGRERAQLPQEESAQRTRVCRVCNGKPKKNRNEIEIHVH